MKAIGILIAVGGLACCLSASAAPAARATLATPAAPAPSPGTPTANPGGGTQSAYLPSSPAAIEATAAYQFRSRIIMSATCIAYADQADAAFLSSTLDDAAKAQTLRRIGASAAQENCLTP